MLPIILCPPAEFDLKPTFFVRLFESSEDHIRRVNQYGGPNQRYRQYSSVIPAYDVNHLDQIYFCLRRIAFPLEMEVESTRKTARQWLQGNRLLELHPFSTKKVVNGQRPTPDINRAFRHCNFSFCYHYALKVGKIITGGRAFNSEVHLSLQRNSNDSKSILWLADRAFRKRDKEVVQELWAKKFTSKP